MGWERWPMGVMEPMEPMEVMEFMEPMEVMEFMEVMEVMEVMGVLDVWGGLTCFLCRARQFWNHTWGGERSVRRG